MTNKELADKYERNGYIDIASDMDGDELKQVIAALRAQPEEALRKDAERYRFLRNTPPWKSPVTVVMTRGVGDDIAMLTHDGLDAVIDAQLPQHYADKA